MTESPVERGSGRKPGQEASPLNPAVLDQLGRLSLVARTVVEGWRSGQHRSPHPSSITCMLMRLPGAACVAGAATGVEAGVEAGVGVGVGAGVSVGAAFTSSSSDESSSSSTT